MTKPNWILEKERKRRTPNGKKYMANYHLKRKYNLTPEEWEEKFDAQGRCCEICEGVDPKTNTGKWHTDHDHKTNKVRGILCQPCNHLLGNAKDDVKILAAALMYKLKYS